MPRCKPNQGGEKHMQIKPQNLGKRNWRRHQKMRKIFHVHGIYRFNAMSTKIPMLFFAEIKKSIQKFLWKHQRQ
jgi:hypothetical protein